MNITRLKTQLILHWPMFGMFTHHITIVISREVPTAGCVDKTILLNDEFMDTLTEAQQLTVIAHELLHYIYVHCPRMKHLLATTQFTQPQINIAMDLLVNYILKESGLKPVPNWWQDDKYSPRDYTVETLLEALKQKGGKGSSGGKSVEQAFSEAGVGQPNQDGKSSQGFGQPDVQASKLSEAEQKMLEQEIKTQVINAAHIAKKMGKLPGSMQSLIDQILESKVDWKNELWDWAAVQVRSECKWTRPNRMFAHQDVYLPSLAGTAMGKLAISIDTSGSVGPEELARFASELNAIRDQVIPTSVIVIYCDAKVQHVDEFDADEEVVIKMHGGGGTDFRPPFDYLAAQSEDDEIVGHIYMTDMYGTFPEQVPDYPVLWLSTSKDQVGPFGRTVFVDFAAQGE